MRYQFGQAFCHAVRIRGLDITTLAGLAEVSPATVSAAVRGRSVNLRTAMRIARTVAGCPVVAELALWSDQEPTEGGPDESGAGRDDAARSPPVGQKPRKQLSCRYLLASRLPGGIGEVPHASWTGGGATTLASTARLSGSRRSTGRSTEGLPTTGPPHGRSAPATPLERRSHFPESSFLD